MTDLSALPSALASAAHDLSDSLLADLSSLGARQHSRLLRLHTPLGPDVLMAERAEITQSIGPVGSGTPDRIELLALSRNAHLQASDLLGQLVLLELLTSQCRTELRPFHGHVTEFRLLGSDGGLARYQLVIEPWLAFLRARVDSWTFQNLSVLGILASVFADYVGQGALTAAHRLDIANPAVYPVLSTLSQFNESDLAFVTRLLQENGLFCWWEYTGNPGDPATLGSHTLVIADHNGALKPNAQGSVRFTQAGAVMKEDSITQWHGHRRVGASSLSLASWDYRSVNNHRGRAQVDAGHGQPFALTQHDQPGVYAFESPAEAQRLATVQLQALEARRKQFHGRGTVRTLAPATTFVLREHSDHDLAAGEDAARFAVLSVTHQARNNISADAQAGLQHLLGQVSPLFKRPQANGSDEPLYEARFTAQRASVPVRPLLGDEHGRRLHPRPGVDGTQTALVVGLGEPVHTDRDGRIKVQFHWQRGASSSHRLVHNSLTPEADNAPASDASGTWVRVAQGWAGANWGGGFIPRLGQEVVVAFLEGDIDRPVVIGSAYNGQGSSNAQGNEVNAGAAQATGNAPAWFPGDQAQGEQEGHAHTATLSGFKSQSLDASQSGGGGHNQLVFDDTPGQGRLLAHTTQSQSWLQMGHLLQQNDNQRLARRGHGLELHTQAQGAVRAGSGLHISTFGRGGGTSTAQGQPTNTREAQSQLKSHADLLKSLNENAQTHQAKLPNEPPSDQLPAHQALQATLASLKSTRSSSDGTAHHQAADASADPGGITAIDGGHGSIPITERPDLILSAATDISSATPAHTVVSAGQNATITTGQDTNLLSQRHAAWAVKDGISLFTRGEAKDGRRAVQDVGLKLHAASGNVNTQAQSDRFTLTAEKGIDLQSTSASVVISAPNKILLNGGGSYLKIEGGDIEVGTSGAATFKGAMKELTGGSSASAGEVNLVKGRQLFDEQFVLTDQVSSIPLAGTPYRIENAKGDIVANGVTDEQGRTIRVTSSRAEKLTIHWGH